MELKNILTPWNWFKKEEEHDVPVRKQYDRTNKNDHPLARLHDDLDQLFEQTFKNFPLTPFNNLRRTAMGGLLRPQLDIAENKTQYTITVEVPGIEEKDIELTLDDGTLTIRGEKKTEKEDHEKQYHRVERSYGAFQRVLSLPTDSDEDNVHATFKNGVLSITVGKSTKASASGRQIPIT